MLDINILKGRADVMSVPPVGRELNIENGKGVTLLHNDVGTLVNIKKRVADMNEINSFLARMQSPTVDNVSDVPMGSRLQPWLSDKLAATKAELQKLDDAEAEVSKRTKVKEFNAAKDKFLAEFYGGK